MQKILNTLRILLSLQNTINVNGILYGLRRIPIIGKYIPEEVYSIKIFKIYAIFVSVNYELIKAFFGKLSLFAALALTSLIAGSFVEGGGRVMFLYGFLLVSLVITIFYDIFRTTKEAEYAVLRLGMNAKEYIHAMFFKQAFNTFTGYAVFGIPAAIISKVNPFIALLIPFAGVGFIAASVGVHMSLYAWKRSLGSRFNKKATRFSVEGGMLIMSFIALFVAFGGSIAIPFVVYYNLYFLTIIMTLLSAFAVIPGIILIRRFPYALYKTAFADAYDKNEIVKEANKAYNKGTRTGKVSISETSAVKTESKGYKYLNELFIKRHVKILAGRVIWTIVAFTVVLALPSVLLYFEHIRLDDFSQSIVRYFIAKHPGVNVFLLFCTNFGSYIAYAMYTNCDSTLLKYSFYRKPEALRQMFRLRIMSVVKLHLIPTVMLAVFNIAAIVLTGGEDYFSQCFFNVLLCFVTTVFFSVRYMTVFYLLQPYTDKFKSIKSTLQIILTGSAGIATFILLLTEIPSIILASAGLLITILYIFTADKLVYKFAPKTFVLK